MGLDMYLFNRQSKANEGYVEPLVYWCKANQIRQWFVNNTELEYDDDCREITLTRDILVNLVRDCQRVLDTPLLAEEIMPTSDGFLFGSTDYDDDYFSDLEYTVTEVNEVLATIPEEDFINGDIYYWDWY